MADFPFSTTPGAPLPTKFGFGSTKDTSNSSISGGGGGAIGGFDSMNQFGNASKSPKRGKPTMENPLLKNNSSSMTGGNLTGNRSGGSGGGITGGGFGGATSFLSPSTAFGRSPLAPMDNNQASSSKAPLTFPLSSTSGTSILFGPPPKASLSLGTGPIIAGLPRPQQLQQTVDSTSPTPDPVESPEFSRATANVLTKTMSPPLATSTGTFSTMMATTTTTAMFATSTTTGNWVVASGYTNRQEYEELKQILLRVGKVVQLKEQASTSQKHPTLAMFTGADNTLGGNSSSVMSGGNWLAVQYESKLAAQEALTNQPFVLHCTGNVCGAFDGMQNGLLQRLTLAAQTSVVTTTRPSLALTADKDNGKTTELLLQTPKKMTEVDLLNLPPRRKSSSGSRNRNSLCDQIVAWLFGWSPEDFAEDGDGIHPKSD